MFIFIGKMDDDAITGFAIAYVIVWALSLVGCLWFLIPNTIDHGLKYGWIKSTYDHRFELFFFMFCVLTIILLISAIAALIQVKIESRE